MTSFNEFRSTIERVNPLTTQAVRILYTVTALYPSVGGVQVHVHQIARRLARQHQVQVVGHWDGNRRDWLRGSTTFAPGPSRRQADGVVLQRMGMSLARRLRMLPWMAMYYGQIRRSADRLAELMLPQLAQVAGPADVIHNHRVGREFLSIASERLARRRGIPFVLTPYHHPRWASRRYQNYLDLYRRADLVCVMTQAEAAALEALGVAPSRLLLVGSAPELASDVSGARFRERHQLGEHPIVLFLGQKYEYKGVRTLLKAAEGVWAHHPTARFVFLGPRTRYSRRVFARHDPRVLELDSVGLGEKSDALAASDILCLPSSQESFGMVFLEAWSLGKPVVGCRIPAVAELVDSEHDGLLVSPGSVSELEAALHRLLTSAELRTRLGQSGMNKVARRYSWERCAEILEEAYHDLRRVSLRSGSERP